MFAQSTTFVNAHGLVNRGPFANDGVTSRRHANSFFGLLLVNVATGRGTSTTGDVHLVVKTLQEISGW